MTRATTFAGIILWALSFGADLRVSLVLARSEAERLRGKAVFRVFFLVAIVSCLLDGLPMEGNVDRSLTFLHPEAPEQPQPC